MSLTVTEGSGEFKSVDAGTYAARCIKMIDLGTQHGEYEGVPNVRKQIMVTWELPTELIVGGDYDGQPYAVSKFYTASLHEKAGLRKDLESWRGRTFSPDELKGFDMRNIVGKACMISVVKNDKGKTKVSGVMALPKGMQCPDQINPSVVFDISEWDETLWANLSDGIKKIISESDEYKAKDHNGDTGNDAPPPFNDDDIPF